MLKAFNTLGHEVAMLVDENAKVKEVGAAKRYAEIFNKQSTEAARQFVFIPAHKNKHPVPVWVSYPFLFRRTEKK